MFRRLFGLRASRQQRNAGRIGFPGKLQGAGHRHGGDLPGDCRGFNLAANKAYKTF